MHCIHTYIPMYVRTYVHTYTIGLCNNNDNSIISYDKKTIIALSIAIFATLHYLWIITSNYIYGTVYLVFLGSVLSVTFT